MQNTNSSLLKNAKDILWGLFQALAPSLLLYRKALGPSLLTSESLTPFLPTIHGTSLSPQVVLLHLSDLSCFGEEQDAGSGGTFSYSTL